MVERIRIHVRVVKEKNLEVLFGLPSCPSKTHRVNVGVFNVGSLCFLLNPDVESMDPETRTTEG